MAASSPSCSAVEKVHNEFALIGALSGALLSLAAGWWGLRDVLRRPVVDMLRQAAQ